MLQSIRMINDRIIYYLSLSLERFAVVIIISRSVLHVLWVTDSSNASLFFLPVVK